MKINFNRMIRSNILANMDVLSDRSFHSFDEKRTEEAGIELQVFANRRLASSVERQMYVDVLFAKDQEVQRLKNQIKKKNDIIKALSALLVATSIAAMLFWAWAIHLRDTIIWYNYKEHQKHVENVVNDEVQ